MLAYQHSGVSVDASVCIEARDRAAPERLLRCGARPPLPWTGCEERATLWCTVAPNSIASLRVTSVAPQGNAGQMRLIAFITDGTQIRKILAHIGVASEPSHISPARG